MNITKKTKFCTLVSEVSFFVGNPVYIYFVKQYSDPNITRNKGKRLHICQDIYSCSVDGEIKLWKTGVMVIYIFLFCGWGD